MDPTYRVDAWELWHARIDALAGPEEAEPDETHGVSDGDGSVPSACPPVVVVEPVVIA